MAKTFNCGIGAALVVSEDLVKQILQDIEQHQEEAWVIGRVVACPEGNLFLTQWLLDLQPSIYLCPALGALPGFYSKSLLWQLSLHSCHMETYQPVMPRISSFLPQGLTPVCSSHMYNHTLQEATLDRWGERE